MDKRTANILRVAIFLMVLTVWLPTAAVLAMPHDNDWLEHCIVTEDIKRKCVDRESRRRSSALDAGLDRSEHLINPAA